MRHQFVAAEASIYGASLDPQAVALYMQSIKHV
jgi:hypothetical protein